jgi:hypothetical protein
MPMSPNAATVQRDTMTSEENAMTPSPQDIVCEPVNTSALESETTAMSHCMKSHPSTEAPSLATTATPTRQSTNVHPSTDTPSAWTHSPTKQWSNTDDAMEDVVATWNPESRPSLAVPTPAL